MAPRLKVRQDHFFNANLEMNHSKSFCHRFDRDYNWKGHHVQLERLQEERRRVHDDSSIVSGCIGKKSWPTLAQPYTH